VDVRAEGDALADLVMVADADPAARTLDWATVDSHGTHAGLAKLSLGTSSPSGALKLDAAGVPWNGSVSADRGVDIGRAAGQFGPVAGVAPSDPSAEPPTGTAPAIPRTATATTVVAHDIDDLQLGDASVSLHGAGGGDLDLDLAGTPAVTGTLTGLPA